MNRLMTIKAKNSELLEAELNRFINSIGAAEMRIIAILKEGKNLVAFINVDLSVREIQTIKENK